MDIESILLDFIEVCRLSNIFDFYLNDIVVIPGHPPIVPPLVKNQMAIYIFMYGEACYKVGKVGSNSNARYISQHYHHKSAKSNLAKSIINDKDHEAIIAEKVNESNIKEWIKVNTKRTNLLLNADKGVFVLNLLEAYLHCRLKPKYEGFESQK